MNNFYPNIISLLVSFLIPRYLYKLIKIQYSNLFKIAHSFYFPKIFKKTTIFHRSLTINPLPFVMINISIHSFATNSKLLHVVINRDIISKNFWFYKKITRNQFKKKKKDSAVNCKKFHPNGIYSTDSSLRLLHAMNDRWGCQFRKFFSASTDCVARVFRGNLQRRRSSWNACPCCLPLPRYSGRVRCKRDSGQGRRREKFSAGSWNVVRTDVTRTANYLKMFQLGRVNSSRFALLSLVTFLTPGSNRFLGSTETIANFFESCKFLLFLYFFFLKD